MRDDESVQEPEGRTSFGRHARYLHDEWDAGREMHGDKHWTNHQAKPYEKGANRAGNRDGQASATVESGMWESKLDGGCSWTLLDIEQKWAKIRSGGMIGGSCGSQRHEKLNTGDVSGN
jgi:hypothetical protein